MRKLPLPQAGSRKVREGGGLNEGAGGLIGRLEAFTRFTRFWAMGGKGRLQNCRFAALARILAGIYDVKVRFLERLFYIGWVGNARVGFVGRR